MNSSEAERLRTLEIRPWLRGKAWPGVALVLVTTALVTWKNVMIAGGPVGGSQPWLRNGVALAAVAVLVTIAVKPEDWPAAIGAPGDGSAGAWVVGLAALGLAIVAVVVADRPFWAWTLIGATLIALTVLWVSDRSEAVAWAVTPASLVVLAVGVARIFRPEPMDLLLLGTVALGTGVLEEVVFRGGLYSLAQRTRDRVVRFLVPGLAFGAWHIMDAVDDARGRGWGPELSLLFVIGTVLVTALASWFILEPLRLRSRSVIGPALLHGAVNSGLIALGLTL